MSTGPRIPLDYARRWAEAFAEQIRPFCHQVEIAGSIRRGKPDVGDVEVVCEPRVTQVKQSSLFGDDRSVSELVALYARLDGLATAGDLGRPTKSGDRYRQYPVPVLGCALDLFIVRPPAQWGVILAIRTGPASFSAELMRRAKQQGYEVRGGALQRQSDGATCLTPDEDDVFDRLGWKWIAPQDRR